MKKIILVSLLSLLFIPLIANASLDTSLYYGLRNNSDVRELQEFLLDKGFYTGNVGGNFLSLTLKAVKTYQKSIGLNGTGYVGILTRTAINNELTAQLSESNTEATIETGTTPPAPIPQATTNDVVATLQAQINALMQQIVLMQQQQTTLSQIQQNTQQTAQNTQQIVRNTCVPNWQCTFWTACSDSRQTRVCSDSNTCGTLNNKPSENQSCVMPPPSDGSIVEIGGLIYPVAKIDADNNINLWQTTWTISNNDVLLNGISFREVGSVNNSDINNFRLYVDGTQIGSAVQSVDSNGYVKFTLSERLNVGSRVIKLVGDVIGGQSRTFSFSLRLKNDVQLVDTKYSKNIEPLSIPQVSPSSEINSAKLVLSKASDSPIGNITNGQDIILAKYNLTANSEDIRINLNTEANSFNPNILSNIMFSIDGLSASGQIIARNQPKIVQVSGNVNGLNNDTIQIKLTAEGEGKSSLTATRATLGGNILIIVAQP